MKRFRLKLLMLFITLIGLVTLSIPNILYSNSGKSISNGTPGNGSLQRAYQVKYRTANSTTSA
jgi:hypothetical protein